MKTRSSKLSLPEQIALWADKIRDISAAGLHYQKEIFDQERYEALQLIAIEMLGLVTNQEVEELDYLKPTMFSRLSPAVAGAAAVIDADERILLMRRADNGLWNMPGGQLEVGESPAEGVIREVYEETGVRCRPIVLSGVYDSRFWDDNRVQQVYKFTFLCEPVSKSADKLTHQHETLEIDWFARDNLPENLYEGHRKRIEDAYAARSGKLQAHFDG